MIDISNPSWAMQPDQVRLLLQVVVDHWHDYWGMTRIDIPAPVCKKEDLPRQALIRHAEDLIGLEDLRAQTVAALEKEHPYHRFIKRGPGLLNADSSPERRLFRAVLWEAMRNLYRDALHPLHLRQRRALSTHWWISGLPFPVPPKASHGVLAEIQAGRTRPFRLSSQDDIWEWLQLTPKQLCVGAPEPVAYLPWSVSQQDWDNLALTSFHRCCETSRLDADWLRKIVHVLPASWETKLRADAVDGDL